MTLRCSACGADNAPLAWRCSRCGGLVELDVVTPLDPVRLASSQGLWRYRDWLPVTEAVTLGEPTTPTVDVSWHGATALLKLEGSLPTGSFKDRGSAVLVSWLVAHGAPAAVVDSSGNAGASLAAYCARAGLACHVYVPKSASPAKIAQIAAYGGVLHEISGNRQDLADAARQACSSGSYAPHAWHPLFLAGTQTVAYEI
jgi:threonine synthase